MFDKKGSIVLLSILLVAVFASVVLPKSVTFSFWGWIRPEWVATYRDYEKQNPDVKIKEALVSQEWASTAEKFLAAVAAGIAPDASIQNSHEFLHFASQGVFYDITPFVQKDQMKAADWFPPQWNGTFFAGKQFALPGITDTRVLYWNKKLFKEAGLDPEKPPETGRDLEAFSAKLIKKDSAGKIVQYGYIPTIQIGMPGAGNAAMWVWLTSTGGEFANSTGTKYTVNNPRFVEGLEWVVNFYDKYCGGAEATSAFLQGAAGAAQDPFLTQRLAMKIDGDWGYWNIASLPDLDIGTAPVPIPDMPGAKRTTFSCGSMYAIPSNSKYPEEAWAFIKWLSGPQGAKSLAANALEQRKKDWERQQLKGKPVYVPNLFNNRLAMRELEKEYLPTLSEKAQRDYKIMIDSLNYTLSCAGLGGTGWGLTGMALFNELGDAFQQAVYHKKTAKEALDYANERLNKGLEEAWAQVKVK
ncbi:MAG: extracellular solute-binding protein [bacterium]